jgi:GNAT superfamily N-acetyltransferase
MTQIKLKYRVATSKDTALLLPLIRSAYRGKDGAAGWTTEADLVADERIDATGLVSKIDAPHSFILVAEDEQNQPISCCEVVWRQGGDSAYFGLFAVDPTRQGGGIGRQVLTYAEEFAQRQWGVRRMEMMVIWLRKDIIDWYARRGYRKTGETRPFPYTELVNGVALRDDLYFDVLAKDLSISEDQD